MEFLYIIYDHKKWECHFLYIVNEPLYKLSLIHI